MEPKASIIVLNWNDAPSTLDCLESLAQLEYDPYEILVVDNGSTDDSVSQIRQRYPNVLLLETGHNLGYAEGNNVGIRHALGRGAEYLFLVNNDVSVGPRALIRLVSIAQRFPDTAFLGPKIYHREDVRRIQSAGADLDFLWRSRQRGLDELDRGQCDALQEVDYVIGAAVLVRARLLDEIGLLDPGFFLYREDVDWCLRARCLKYRVLYVPQAEVWHRSHHVREHELPRVTYYMTRNSLMLVRKHHGGSTRLALLLLRHMLTAATWTIRPKWRHKRDERNALLKGILSLPALQIPW
jgi:GT2 family glycosyltransferase